MNQSYGTTNVGFDPGVVNGTAPVYTKGRYQQMLAEQMYGERDFRRALEDPWGEWVTRSVVYYGIIMGLFAFCMAGVLIRGVINAKDAGGALFYVGLLVVFAGWGVYIMYTRVVSTLIETAQFAEWKKTPEGAYWVQAYLHQKPWDPQNPMNPMNPVNQRNQAVAPPGVPMPKTRTAGTLPNLYLPPR